jgi:hypothetical protein
VLVAGTRGYDAGTAGVSGVETGVGTHIEAIGFRSASAIGVGPALAVAGYPTAGDADPLWFTTAELRFRHTRDRSPFYWEGGTGFGIAWVAGPRQAVAVAQFEVGVKKRAGSVLLFAGARERFLGLLGTGSPPGDVFNSLHAVVGLGFGEPPSRSRPR